MPTDTLWPGHEDTWFPNGHYGTQVENTARQIVAAARDHQLEVPDDPILEVRFMSFKDAQDVVDCLNERYLGAHGSRIHVTLLD